MSGEPAGRRVRHLTKGPARVGKQLDGRPPLHRALDAAAGLRAGSWESVESLALLAIEAGARGLPESGALLESAHTAAAGIKAGSYDSVRALAVLARAERELGSSSH